MDRLEKPDLSEEGVAELHSCGLLDDEGRLTFRGACAVLTRHLIVERGFEDSEKEMKEHHARLESRLAAMVREVVWFPAPLVAFIAEQAALRGNDTHSLVREVLHQWAESRGYRASLDAAQSP